MATWSIPLDKLAKKQGKKIEDVVRGVTILAFQRVVLRSPVDTGRFRANWNVAYGSYDSSTSASLDPEGKAKSDSVSSGVLSFPVGGIVYLTNSLPYAGALEYGLYPNPPIRGSKKRGEDGYAIHVIGGYSMQAPQGMVRITAREFADAVRAAVKDVQ